mgnify:CR=1 FL=1
MTSGVDNGTGPPAELEFSVIVPCFDAESTIRETLDSLVGLRPPAKEIIVVDDHSTDASAELCDSYPVHLIRQMEHRGVAAARNRGASVASGNVLLFVDADIVVPSGLVAALAAAHGDRPDSAGFSVVIDPDFHRGGFFSDYLNRRMYNGFTHLRSGVTTLCTSCASVLKDAFDRVGGFDEAGTRAVNDEATLGWRLAEFGLRTDVLENIQVRHLKEMSLGSWCRKFLHEGRQWVLLVSRHRRRRAPSAKLTLQVRRPLNVVLMAVTAVQVASAPWLGSAVLLPLGSMAVCFVILNSDYLAWMARGRGLFWSLAALLMVILEAALHLVGLASGVVAEVLPG